MLCLWREGFDLPAPWWWINLKKIIHASLIKSCFSVHLLLNTLFSPLTTGLVIQLSLSFGCLNEKPKAGHKHNAYTEWDHYFPQSQISKTFPSIIAMCHLNLCLFQINGIRSRLVWCHNMPTSISTSAGRGLKRPWFCYLKKNATRFNNVHISVLSLKTVKSVLWTLNAYCKSWKTRRTNT